MWQGPKIQFNNKHQHYVRQHVLSTHNQGHVFLYSTGRFSECNVWNTADRAELAKRGLWKDVSNETDIVWFAYCATFTNEVYVKSQENQTHKHKDTLWFLIKMLWILWQKSAECGENHKSGFHKAKRVTILGQWISISNKEGKIRAHPHTYQIKWVSLF